jgi:hypothetical protein
MPLPRRARISGSSWRRKARLSTPVTRNEGRSVWVRVYMSSLNVQWHLFLYSPAGGGEWMWNPPFLRSLGKLPDTEAPSPNLSRNNISILVPSNRPLSLISRPATFSPPISATPLSPPVLPPSYSLLIYVCLEQQALNYKPNAKRLQI